MRTISLLLLATIFCMLASAQNKVEVEIKTGADNLEVKDFMENPSIVLRIRNKADIVVPNINKGQNWPNNSIRRITIPLTDDVYVSDISEIELIRKDKDGSKNNVEAAAADNWNINKFLVTGTFKKEGRTEKWQLLLKEGNPMMRFVYEKRNHNQNETDNSIRYVIVDEKIISGAATPTPARPDLVIARPVKIEVEIGNGGDDLRGGGDNMTLKFFLKNNPNPIVWRNVNNNRKWDNFTVKNAYKTFNQILDFNAIEKIEMWHDGGGGIGADNWHVDKVLIIAKQDDGAQKILVDKVGAPLHQFTGESRKKVFYVE